MEAGIAREQADIIELSVTLLLRGLEHAADPTPFSFPHRPRVAQACAMADRHRTGARGGRSAWRGDNTCVLSQLRVSGKHETGRFTGSIQADACAVGGAQGGANRNDDFSHRTSHRRQDYL